MSDLERATDVVMEAMGCEYAYDSAARAGFCSRHDFGWLVSDRACGHASRIAKAVEDYFERTVVADAWDDGYDAGHATARAVNAEYPNPTPNPYRRAES